MRSFFKPSLVKKNTSIIAKVHSTSTAYKQFCSHLILSKENDNKNKMSSQKYVPPHLRQKIIDEMENGSHSNSNGSSNDNVRHYRQMNENGSSSSYKKPFQRSFDAFSSGGNKYNNRDRDYAPSERRNNTRTNNYEKSSGFNSGFNSGFKKENDYHREEKETEALFTAPNTGINFDAYEDIPVKVTGKEVPNSIETFAEANLPKKLMMNIEKCSFSKPTPVQKYAIPIAMNYRDLMSCAQTGSGKTCAFLFPIISHLLTEEDRETVCPHPELEHTLCTSPTALILAPTRELSTQIYDEARKFTYRTGKRTVVLYGGTSVNYQIKQLSQGCDILVATPGRLVDLIDRGSVSLTQIKYLVLDEADRMLDMGFEPQIRYIVEKTGMPGPGIRNTLLFSATFPKDIQMMAKDFLHNYLFLTVGRIGSTHENITQKFLYCNEDEKKDLLLQTIASYETLTLIFVQTKRDATHLEFYLMRNGFKAVSIHGDKSQREREIALDSFRTGSIPILVATDVASRGLDISNVGHVINYDLPENINDYVHRIGRTGRAGKAGVSTAFFTEKNAQIAEELIKLLEESKQDVPDFVKEAADYARHQRYQKTRAKKSTNSLFGGGRGRGRGGGSSFFGNSGRSNNHSFYHDHREDYE
ncbi:hypothetical protein ABK040_006809 [Willaertia magna]